MFEQFNLIYVYKIILFLYTVVYLAHFSYIWIELIYLVMQFYKSKLQAKPHIV